jgi:hypothetical protein
MKYLKTSQNGDAWTGKIEEHQRFAKQPGKSTRVMMARMMMTHCM